MSKLEKVKFPAAVLLLLLTALGALCCCGGELSWKDFLQCLGSPSQNEAAAAVFWQIRLPRIAGAAAAGALLAAAGCTVQLLFRNPLSSPHVLGSVNTAALGAVAVWLLGGTTMAGMLLGSTAGALASLVLLLFIGRGYQQTGTLLLAGIALNAFAASAMSGILFISGEHLEGIIFWLLGGFWRLDWLRSAILLTGAGVVMLILLLQRREMNMLYLGERAAAAAGVNTRQVIAAAVLAAALATALVVGNCGVIGFVGLLIPHIARRIYGGEFRNHLLGAGLLGAILLIAADWAGRCLFAPLEMPVGILTSLIGAPFFFILIVMRLKTPGGRQ